MSNEQMTQDTLIVDAVTLLKDKGFENIRVDLDDYEKPSKLQKKGSPKAYIPDLTAKQDDGKCYFEIVRKSENNEGEQIEKWSLLSTLAKHRNGKFFLLVPHGKLNYTRQILEKNDIEAEVVKL